MAPFPPSFVLFDPPVRFRGGTSLNDDGRGKEDPPDRMATTGAKGQFGFSHPLDHFKTRSTMVTTLLRVASNIDINRHPEHPKSINNVFSSIVKRKTLML